MVVTDYKGHPLFLTAPDWSSRVENTFSRDNTVFVDAGYSTSWTYFDRTVMGLKAEFLLVGKDGIRELTDFFDDRMGRWEAFWVPSWQADVVVTGAIGATDRDISVSDFNYSDYWGEDEVCGRFLHFYLPDGTSIVRGCRPLSDTVLRLEEALGVEVTEAQLGALLVSFLFLVRFDQDELRLKYLTAALARAELTFRAVSHESPVMTTSTTTSTTTTGTTTTTT